MNEEKRLCVGCGKELYEFVDICPYCQADNRESKKVLEADHSGRSVNKRYLW